MVKLNTGGDFQACDLNWSTETRVRGKKLTISAFYISLFPVMILKSNYKPTVGSRFIIVINYYPSC